MSDDILYRAKAALRALDSSSYGGSAEDGALAAIARENQFIRTARTLVPELAAEVERLRRITDIIDPDSVYLEQRDQAWAERDRLRDREAQIRKIAEFWTFSAVSRRVLAVLDAEVTA